MPSESTTVDSLNIQIKTSSKKATSGIEALVTSLRSLRDSGAVQASARLEALAESFLKLSTATKDVRSFSSAVKNLNNSLEASVDPMRRFNNALMETTNIVTTSAMQMKDVGITLDEQQTKDQTDAVSAQASAMRDLATVLSALEEKLPPVKEEMEGVADAAKKAAKETKKAKKETNFLKTAFEKVTNPIKKFAKAIGRIALYRAIRTAIKEVSQAVREGLTNLNEYSKAVGTDFAKAVESLKKHANLLKNAFATALRPVIEALIPVIEQLCVWLANAADFLAQVFSIITGKVDDKGRYTKAVLGDLEESTEQAKELKRTLLGFDEINRLDGDTGGGSGTAVGTQFIQEEISPEARETAERLQAIIERIKTFINDTDWEAVTGFLGLALTVLGFASGSIPAIIAGAVMLASNIEGVTRALEKAKNKVSQFAEKIKKATDTGNEDFDKFKNTAIDAAATVVNSVLDIVGTVSSQIADTVDTVGSIIQKVLSGDIKGALEDFIAYLGRTWGRVGDIVGSLGDIVVALVNDVILNAIEFGFEWIRKKLVGLLDGAIESLRGAKDSGLGLLSDILAFIRDSANNVLGVVRTIIEFCKSTVSTIVNIIKLLFKGDIMGALGELVLWIIDLLTSIVNIVIAVLNIIISAVLNLIINPIMHAIEWLWNNVLVPVINWIAQAIYDVARKVTQVMEDIANGIQDGLKWVWNNVILKFLNTLMSGVVGKINDIIEWSNRVLGTEIKPIDLQVIPDWEPERYDFALPEQEVKIVGEWEFKDFEFQIPAVDWTEFKEKARSAIKVVEDEVVSLTTLMKRTIKEAQETHIGTRTITAYANGGYPTAGSLFVAGERPGQGPEFVGSFGGQTGVWNSDQLVQGMYNAFTAALSNMPSGGDIYLDGQVIYKNVVRRNNNYVRSTGRTALLT